MVWYGRPVLLLSFGAERLAEMGRSFARCVFSVIREQGARTTAMDGAGSERLGDDLFERRAVMLRSVS
jgi:hypothetical protein